MIYTVTINPAIDYVMRVGALCPGRVNRSEREEIHIGGKGVNVSVVLRELGVDSVALGFTAGFTGDAIESGLQRLGIKTDFIRLEQGCSRINVKIKGDGETDLNGQGPTIDERALEALFAKLDRLTAGDMLVLAGSVPRGLPDHIYGQIIKRLSHREILFTVDASGDLLKDTLPYRPFLIKPNRDELGELFGVSVQTAEQAAEYAGKLRGMGARNVLVSMAGEGAILVDQNGDIHKMGAAKGTVIDSVGAGDSMVAGFLAGYLKTADFSAALALGTAAGGATAFSAGLAKRETIDQILKQNIPFGK